MRKSKQPGKPAKRVSNDPAKLDHFWSHLSTIAKHALPHKYPVIQGIVRSRNLSALAKLCDDGLLSAVQDGNAGEYVRYASIKSAFSKYEGCASPNGRAVALETWFKAERSCRRANRRIRLTALQNTSGNPDALGKQYWPMLLKAQRIIRHVLGRFDFSEFAESCRHGPGTALGCSGLATSGAFKYASRVYTVSPSSALLFRDVVITDNVWFNLVTKHRTELRIVEDCDKLSFVPKNWKTERSISVGPLGNTYLQLGVGEMICARLKRVGIDLSDQSNNQRAAFGASKLDGPYGDGHVTLDLSMASDTLCRELVKLLVPEDWYRILDSTRCQCTTLPDGRVIRLSKFSAMGNGFTFPLETLIFFALSQAAMSHTRHRNKIWVYGDDIIVPRGCALLLTELLRWSGFSVNIEKSFYHGSFYESCGADYLGGLLVRPVYWKRRLHRDRDYYVLINGYSNAFPDVPDTAWRDRFRDHLLRSCRNSVLYGPPLRGATSIPDDRVVTADRSLYRIRTKDGIDQCQVFCSSPRRKPVVDDFAYLQARHGLRSGTPMRYVLDDSPPADPRGKDGYLLVPIRATKDGRRWISVS